ncbi:dihydrofolate reductase family protein [Patulibacter sp. SYSU D01012]|uniref:dihydrofolate reductase family protein n=1 Tax=Patulibacter sp. SYSU D01012 TaxID=2817381 RepID=UPI001B306EFF|nr:dihydrofolate reductase family protein [Patulibacter sp. SYSU D01012]
MRRVTYSMSSSLDGFAVGPDGGIDWGAPSDELFRFYIERQRDVGVQLMGRRLYETMLYWEDAAEDPALSAAHREWVALWNPLPKVVFSRTLAAVRGAARLAEGTLAEEIARLRDAPDAGDIAIGGPTLAAQAAELGLIDEYRVRIHPVLLGGGLPYFPRVAHQTELELVETRAFDQGVVYLRHRVVR